jgi:XcyI restriction endonuclease
MARSSGSDPIDVPEPSRQLVFHELLLGARRTVLRDALREAVAEIDPDELAAELAKYAPRRARTILAKAGLRDEEVFPTPVVLRQAPTLVGYYRLLLGISQKQFYAAGAGTSRFKAMEERGVMRPKAEAALPALCRAMGTSLAALIEQLSPRVTQRDLESCRC